MWKTVCDPYPSSTVTFVAALVTYSHTLMTWLQKKKNKKKKKRKSKEMLDSKMKSTFPTFRRKSQTTISDNIIDWGISLGNAGVFTRIWANFWTDDVFTWVTSQHGTVQILLRIAVLFRIIRRFWETAHLPLPYGNIFPQVRSKCWCWLREGLGGSFPETSPFKNLHGSAGSVL